MGVILDTNVFIAAERSREAGKLRSLLYRVLENELSGEALVSVITASELLIGVHRAVDNAIRERRRAFVDAILDQFNTVPIDLRVAREHSRLASGLMAKGRTIGAHDSWIAATALAYGHSVATSNAREFNQVAELTVIEVDPDGR